MIRKLILLVALLPIFSFAQEDTTRQKTTFACFPALSYSPETSLLIGAVGMWALGDNTPKSSAAFKRQSTVSAALIYTLKNQTITSVSISYFTPKQNLLKGTVRFFNFTDSYYGIGNNNSPGNSEVYTNTYYRIRGSYFKSKNSKTFVGLSWNGQYNSISDFEEKGLLKEDSPNGIDGGYLFQVGPAVRLDTRDNNIYPTKGHFVSFSSLFAFVGDFNFTDLSVDARKFVSLWDKENILAFQFASSFILGNDVPFYKLPLLGGDDRLRGITNASLYTDKQMMYGQVEYRRPLFWRFGMTVFAGLGDVANRFDAFSARDLKYVYGLGCRFTAIEKSHINIRLDVGKSKGNQFAIYVIIGEAF